MYTYAYLFCSAYLGSIVNHQYILLFIYFKHLIGSYRIRIENNETLIKVI